MARSDSTHPAAHRASIFLCLLKVSVQREEEENAAVTHFAELEQSALEGSGGRLHLASAQVMKNCLVSS